MLGCRREIDEIDRLLSLEVSSGKIVVPEQSKIFAALAMLPSEVSVIVIGQDPYPTPDHAIGLAFAVPDDTQPLPGSLRNIFKEVLVDTGSPSQAQPSLGKWVDQGVLLLNTSLTTESGIRAAHSTWPWDPIVRAIITHVVDVNPQVVGLLFGNHAIGFEDMFESKSIVCSAHPSPLSANRGFHGSKPFTRVNEVLVKNEGKAIIW